MLALLSTFALFASLVEPTTEPSQTFAIKAAHLHLGDGRSLDDGVILVEDGKISAVGRGVDVPKGVAVFEHKGSVTAGWIACHSYAGVADAAEDDTRSFLPEARIVHAFDGEHGDYKKALRAGITSVVIAPQPDNVAAGVTAVVKCAGGKIVRSDAHLELSLEARANRINREPTSPGGTLAELTERFQKAKGAFADAASGKLPVMIAARERSEIEHAIDFATGLHLKGTLLDAPLAGELAADVKRSGLSVVFAPLGIGSSRREIQSIVLLAKSGVPFAFAVDQPMVPAEALRISTALCVREGLDRATALRSVTSDAARIAGVDGQIGSLEKGLDADFVLWSGDPLDLGSHPVAVYVDGVERLGGAQ